tara:strand:+ start:105 stop:575 length:471 start_codon:yes stop_codon:yes gene_type:complete
MLINIIGLILNTISDILENGEDMSSEEDNEEIKDDPTEEDLTEKDNATIEGIIKHGIAFDARYIGVDAILKGMEDFFSGEGFSSKREGDSIVISRGHPIARIMVDSDKVSFAFYDALRGFQVIMLTVHFIGSYSHISNAIENAHENTVIMPIAIDE